MNHDFCGKETKIVLLFVKGPLNKRKNKKGHLGSNFDNEII